MSYIDQVTGRTFKLVQTHAILRFLGLVTHQYLRNCCDSILKYHTKKFDVSTGRRHGYTPQNSMEIWYAYTESGTQL
jgi:hypothetical protein